MKPLCPGMPPPPAHAARLDSHINRSPDTPGVHASPSLTIGVLTLDWPPTSGGMSRFCVETFSALARRGHRVIVLTGKAGPSPATGIEVHGGLTGDLSVDGALAAGFENRIDLWHAWEHGFGGLAGTLNRPMVVTIHGNDLLRPKAYYRFTRTPMLYRLASRMRRPTWQAKMCHRALQDVHCFLPNSCNTARLLTRSCDMKSRIEVVPCGVSDSFFQPHKPPSGLRRLLTVCSLSRQRRRKNVDGVLHALAQLKEEVEFHYDVCGDGDWMPELRALAWSLDLHHRVSFHGSVSEDRLRTFYAAADLFVLAPWESIDDVEGFGIVNLEANAAGTPVLATRTGGVPDAVSDGLSGFFAQSCDPCDIASALRRFLSGDVQFDVHAVRSWADQHRYDSVAGRYEGVYESILARVGRP